MPGIFANGIFSIAEKCPKMPDFHNSLRHIHTGRPGINTFGCLENQKNLYVVEFDRF
jgi:hypothetical protein